MPSSGRNMRLQRRWLELANEEKLGDHGFKAMHFQADATS
jgi:hypothetical protein